MQPSIFQTAKLACHDAASAALAAPALFALMWVAQFGTNRLDALVVPGGPRTLSLTLAAWTILSVLIGGLATTLMAVFIHRRIIWESDRVLRRWSYVAGRWPPFTWRRPSSDF